MASSMVMVTGRNAAFTSWLQLWSATWLQMFQPCSLTRTMVRVSARGIRVSDELGLTLRIRRQHVNR